MIYLPISDKVIASLEEKFKREFEGLDFDVEIQEISIDFFEDGMYTIKVGWGNSGETWRTVELLVPNKSWINAEYIAGMFAQAVVYEESKE